MEDYEWVRDVEGRTDAAIVANRRTRHEYIVVAIDDACMVMDFYDESLARLGWSTKLGYAITSPGSRFAHHMVMGTAPSPDLSIDHINRIRLDNRRANLRWATSSMQNMNRGVRVDRRSVPPEMQQDMGFDAMPRYMTWDGIRHRYSFYDLPGLQPGVSYHGTSASECSHAGRYLDALEKYVAAAELSSYHQDMTTTKRLAREYIAIVQAAHNMDPTRFPAAPHVEYWEQATDLELARSQIVTLRAHGVQVVHGPLNLDSEHVRVELEDGSSCMVMKKGGKMILYDEVFKDDMLRVNVDTNGDSPVYKFPGESYKRRLADIVWVRFAGRTLPTGSGAVPLNYHLNDVRLDNLIVMDGGGKSNKAIGSREITGIPDFGMKYVPRGIRVSWSQTVRQDVRATTPDKQKASFSCTPGDLEGLVRCIRKAVQFMIDNDPTFSETNARFQESMRTYDAVMATELSRLADTPT